MGNLIFFVAFRLCGHQPHMSCLGSPFGLATVVGRVSRSAILRGMTSKGKKGSAAAPEDMDQGRVYDQMKAFAVPNRPRQNPSLTESDLDERAAAVKSWSRYRVKQERENSKRMLELTAARDNALAELKMVD